ncbi:hypothetical protein CEXT_291061 [Caerostris extrusa]|uniref:Uncharacterized protein n=1 Tax=Caerostris extrusa TaxID=172846 RepID=A0AAV4NT30_CAEEX|nr:hypothetical protein CEXT_291061 [Caerostris extrusa]
MPKHKTESDWGTALRLWIFAERPYCLGFRADRALPSLLNSRVCFSLLFVSIGHNQTSHGGPMSVCKGHVTLEMKLEEFVVFKQLALYYSQT